MLEWLSVSFVHFFVFFFTSSSFLSSSLILSSRAIQQQQHHHGCWNESAYFNALRPMFYSRYRHTNSAACTQFFCLFACLCMKNVHNLISELPTSILDFIWEQQQQKEKKGEKKFKSIKTLSLDHFLLLLPLPLLGFCCATLIWKNTIAFC